VILFDLAIPAEVFGRQVERDRYTFEVCTELPGTVSCTSGVDVHVPRGLRALDAADTVIAREVGTTPTAYRSAFRGAPTPKIPEATNA
jgi:hypothetical protein